MGVKNNSRQAGRRQNSYTGHVLDLEIKNIDEIFLFIPFCHMWVRRGEGTKQQIIALLLLFS